MTILVGDIGATNARFAVISAGGGALELIAERTLPSRRFPSLSAALGTVLESCAEARAAERACFGLAGPIRDGRCEITNLPWTVDAAELARTHGLAGVELLNDVEAAAWGLTVVGPEGFRTLAEGAPGAAGNRCLVAPGTGLGAATLLWDGARHHPYATEGGHADFAPADDEQVELWRFLRRRHGHVSWERVVSGPGLETIYRFVLERAGLQPPGWLPPEATDEQAEGDGAAKIAACARDDPGGPSARALDLFFALLGALAGNLALSTLATGGVYLAGGMVWRLLPELAASRFLAAFAVKGRMGPLLEAMPVRAVADHRLALWGAAAHAARAARDGGAGVHSRPIAVPPPAVLAAERQGP